MNIPNLACENSFLDFIFSGEGRYSPWAYPGAANSTADNKSKNINLIMSVIYI